MTNTDRRCALTDCGPSAGAAGEANPSGTRREARRGAKGRPSSEAADSGFREKLLAIMPMRPVPKPTQVGKARSLR